jgi:hypothetical protein
MGFVKNLFDRTPLTAQIEKQKEQEWKELKADIEKLKLSRTSKIKSKESENNVSTSIQLLIFHYMGLLNQVELDNSKKAILLSVIFNRDGAENIRKHLSNVGGKNSKFMTKANLQYVCDLFEKLGLTEPLKRAQKDLDKAMTK